MYDTAVKCRAEHMLRYAGGDGPSRAMARRRTLSGVHSVCVVRACRFSASYRHYKYFFHLEEGMDLEAMRDGAARLVGEHDFRNFCKMKAAVVHNFRREVHASAISAVPPCVPVPPCRLSSRAIATPRKPIRPSGPHQLLLEFLRVSFFPLPTPSSAQFNARSAECLVPPLLSPVLSLSRSLLRRHLLSLTPSCLHALTSSSSPAPRRSCGACPLLPLYVWDVRGSAFLYHQVRCMVSVLFMVARGQEKPALVSQLLDQSVFLHKPVYAMASEEPLVLYQCGFRDPIQVRLRFPPNPTRCGC